MTPPDLAKAIIDHFSHAMEELEADRFPGDHEAVSARFFASPEIEEALAGHPAVAFVGAIGQPDAFAGELPCAYVELVADAEVTNEELMEHARANIHERAAVPKHLEVMDELPKTAVGKILRRRLREK